ncbi:MAG: hypothetical protein IPM29_10300 [Planctomycetes bacterium]|nr:hypothetical protein [Planctomycetota bacterium]
MIARMQVSTPELTDLRTESAATRALYDCARDQPSIARACLHAR